MKKRILEIILIIFMSLSIFPNYVYSEEIDDINHTSSQDAGETTGDDTELNTTTDSEQDNQDTLEEFSGDEALLPESNALLLKKDADNDKEDKENDVRTIMMYVCGSDLETYSGSATYNIEQILNSSFPDEEVNFIIMLGGAEQWFVDSKYLWDPITEKQLEKVDTTYTSIWKVQSKSEEENGKLLLLDGDGILGDGDEAKRNAPLYIYDEEDDEYYEDDSLEYERMNDPEVLRSFIDYCVQNYPAEKYDLILWDHGGGPTGGFGIDFFDGKAMPFSQLLEALSDNEIINNGDKFDFINFDACLMNYLEIVLPLIELTDYYMASPETIPSYGQQYKNWIEMLNNNPDENAYELGKQIVDDFYNFYEPGYGDGTRQEGTMAVIDMNALKANGFVDQIGNLFVLFAEEILNGLYYDELFSYDNSIRYGSKYFYDLGNIISQISIAQKEIDVDDIDEDELNFDNRYLETAQAINEILNDENILYNCSTHGIYTGDFIYRDVNGDIKFSDSTYSPRLSSGIYVCYVDMNQHHEVVDYYDEIAKVIGIVKDSRVRKTLDNYRKALIDVVMVAICGKTISKMVNEGYEKEDINYNSIKEYWKIDPQGDSEYGIDFSDWAMYIEDFIRKRNYDSDDSSIIDVETKEFLSWMNIIIPKQVEEAIDKDKVDLYVVDRAAGEGYKIVINDTKKRVIDKVNYEIIAELPMVDKFLKEEGLEWLKNKELEFSLGTVSGEEEYDIDFDSGDSFAEIYIKWLNGSTSSWNVDAIQDKWYAINDADGNNHVILAIPDTDMYFTIATYKKEKTIEIETDDGIKTDTVYEDEYIGIYFKDGKISHIMMSDEDGNYRSVRPSELNKEIEITPVIRISMFVSYLDIPISTPFVLSADNNKDVNIIFTDVDNIPDIDDINGDGKKLNKRLVVTDIYKSKIDISELIDNPTGALTDIEKAIIDESEYTGVELNPVIKVNGNVLEEGKDYRLIKATDDTKFKNAGRYFVGLEGIGAYTGYTSGTFIIRPLYKLTDGTGATWKKGSVNGLLFRYSRLADDSGSDYAYQHFADGEVGIWIDNKFYEKGNDSYTYLEGSLIIKLKPSLLNSLSLGDHTIVVSFIEDDDIVKTSPAHFTILKETYRLPMTGIE